MKFRKRLEKRILPISSITDKFDCFKVTFKRFPPSWCQHLWRFILYTKAVICTEVYAKVYSKSTIFDRITRHVNVIFLILLNLYLLLLFYIIKLIWDNGEVYLCIGICFHGNNVVGVILFKLYHI